MSERIPQSVAKLVVFRAYLASDGKTPATGKTIAITISKNGGAFGNPNAGATNATEISSGFYKFTLDTTDAGTVGPLAWRGAHADIDDAGDCYSVTTETASVDAIKAKTDQLAFGTANRVNAQVYGMESNVLTAAALAADAASEIAAAVETAILNEGDLSAVLEAIRLKIEESDDDLTTTLIANAVWASASRTLTAGTNIQLPSNALALITAWAVELTGNLSKLLRADRKIDKTTNPAHWDEVLLEEGTVTELLRRELFDVDGNALADDETIIGRAIKP